jgi:hypothetical protein
VRAVDLAHPADAEQGCDLIRAEVSASRQRHARGARFARSRIICLANVHGTFRRNSFEFQAYFADANWHGAELIGTRRARLMPQSVGLTFESEEAQDAT